MSRALPWLLLCLIAASASAEERAFVETVTARDQYFVHEPIRLTLRVGIDAAFLKANVVQMFQSRLDAPLQVQAPWLRELPGTVARREAEGDEGATFALNGSVARAQLRTEGGRTVLELTRTFFAESPGELAVSATELRLAWGTEFVDDFIHGRVATDRREMVVAGKPLELTIKPLPAPGRPADFGNAVGRFTVQASAEADGAAVGEVFKLVLRIEGHGNLERFDTPRVGPWAGFHVYGMLDDRGAAMRTITYDLAPLSASKTVIPEIRFEYFDPERAAYRTATTTTIPLSVRGGDGPASGEEPAVVDAAGTDYSWWAVPMMAAVLALALWIRLRRRRPARGGPDAAAVFRERARKDLAAALTEFLATHLRCAPASVIAPGLVAKLEAAGASHELATRTAALLESLVDARYGGAAPPKHSHETAHELVDALRTIPGE